MDYYGNYRILMHLTYWVWLLHSHIPMIRIGSSKPMSFLHDIENQGVEEELWQWEGFPVGRKDAVAENEYKAKKPHKKDNKCFLKEKHIDVTSYSLPPF